MQAQESHPDAELAPSMLESSMNIVEPPPRENPYLYRNSPLVGSSIEAQCKENPQSFYNAKDPHIAILKEKPEHRLIISLKAKGHSNREIARLVGYSELHVGTVVRQPWAREALLDEWRRAGVEETGALLQSEALNSIFQIVHLRDTSMDDGVKLRASQDILDRHLGKATQRVETHNETFVVTGKVEDIDRKLAELRAEEQRLLGAPTPDAQPLPDYETVRESGEEASGGADAECQSPNTP